VALARATYERFRQLIHEFAKFGVIGLIGLVITNGGYDLLHNKFGVGPVSATTIATIVATMVAYVGNRYWSFRHRERTNVMREGVVFFVLNGIGLLIQDAAVAVNYYILGLSNNKFAEFVALNVGIAIATLFRFWSYRKWVWLAPPVEQAGHGAPRQPEPDRPLPTAAGTPPPADARAPDGEPSPVRHANGHPVPGRMARTGSPTQR
jgi:putative flippase GtrA